MPIDPSSGLYIPSPPAGYGYGGAEYGFSPYGASLLPRSPYPPGGGFGGAPFGTSSYGSSDILNPRVSSAQSLDGFRVEVFFSEEMQNDAELLDATNYVFTPTIGAPVTASSVAVGTAGTYGGFTSVIVTHTGTTLGGSYSVQVSDASDLSANPVDSVTTATFYALGSPPTYTVTPTAGDKLLVDFSHDMLAEADFTPGIETAAAYNMTSAYPVDLTVTAVEHTAADKVTLTVKGQTSVAYTANISPATAIDFNGDTLPSAATSFTGVEVGTGTSTVSVNGVLLTKAVGDTYGWSFVDTSGKILANSSFRADLVLDPSSAVYSPVLGDSTLGTWLVSDGAVQVSISLKRVSGVDVLDIVSGGYAVTATAAWSSGQAKITLLRNQKADHYAFLFNDTVLLAATTSSLNGSPTISPGCQFTLGVVYGVTQLPLKTLDFTSSQTVFSSAWNFLHSVGASFTGSAALTRSTLVTKRGPLVKGWGDGTPATTKDVAVRVNGTAVTVSKVNPYTGKLTLATPVPLMPVGEMTVATDYTWFKTPLMRLAGLNTEGLVLNQWDHPQGRNTPSASPTGETGVARTSRYTMSVVLGPVKRSAPKFIGHRYLGFERDQSALLNSPTLLLNRNPHRAGLADMDRTPPGVTVAYEGPTDPRLASTPWELDGTDAGTKSFSDLTWVLDDQTITGAVVYHRGEDLSFPSAVVDAVRFKVDTYTATGVFSGVAFGLHNNHDLFLVGCLDVNGVKHIGMITDASRPEDLASWSLGLGVKVEVTAANTFTASTSLLPTNLAADLRLQVTSGSQTGIYTIKSVTNQSDGTTTVVLKSNFPADYKLWANNDPTVYFEVDWSSTLTTYRLAVAPSTGVSELFLGGALAGKALTLTTPTAYPAQTSLVLPTGNKGRFFFGSLSVAAKNRTRWAFRQYGVQPTATTIHSRGLVVASEMGSKPEDEATNKWFVTQEFGYSEIDATGDTLLLKGTSGGTTTFGYGRIEPLLVSTTYIDLDAKFKVESGTAPGDATIIVQDGEREVQLGTLLYKEAAGARSLVSLDHVALSGVAIPTAAGWTAGTGLTTQSSVLNSLLTITQSVEDSGTWYNDLAAPSSGGRIFEARVALLTWTANSSNEMGPVWGCEVGTAPSAAWTVAVGFLANPARVFLHSNGTPVATFTFDWSDKKQHTYRVLADPTTAKVSLLVDDLLLGTADLTDFDSATTDTMAFIGSMGTDTAFTMEMDAFSAQEMPSATAKRTLGILTGTDTTNIDHWAIPRTDSTSSDNSSLTATVEEMDWTQEIRLRLHRDPHWGVQLLRPDLPLPSTYNEDFATQATEPTAGWINVEYRKLPRTLDTFGGVKWGALASASVTQQRWREVRYRVFQYPDEDYLAPHHMVLNRANVIHSGELGTDITVESVVVNSLTSRLVSLYPAHIFADRVFTVTAGGSVLASSTWTFDKESQTIELTTALSAASTAVTVTFAPGTPVTTTYLKGQPFFQTLTKLNEGTPPYPKSESAGSTTEMQFGSRVNDPHDTLGDPDFILNDPYRTVKVKNDASAKYESLEFFEADDGGDANLPLSLLNDGPAAEEGFTKLAFEGTQFTEQHVKADAFLSDSLDNNIQQTSMFHASGGAYTGGTLAPGTMVLWPNAMHSNQPEKQATRKRLTWDLKFSSVLTDSADSGSDTSLADTVDLGTDNSPPLTVDGGNGTAGSTGNGAAVYRLEDGAGLYSRTGPWGPGILALDDESLLAGGAVLDGTEFLLLGGAAVSGPAITNGSVEAAN